MKNSVRAGYDLRGRHLHCGQTKGHGCSQRSIPKDLEDIYPRRNREKPAKFLGVEIFKEKTEKGERRNLNQQSYVAELLATDLNTTKPRRIPISRDQGAMEKDDETPTSNDAKLAQKCVGELLRLVTRTRPDLMFSVDRMAACVLHGPKKVQEVGAQTKGYLQGTKQQGLIFQKGQEEDISINIYTDASYAPRSEESHGCFVILISQCPVFGDQVASQRSPCQWLKQSSTK